MYDKYLFTIKERLSCFYDVCESYKYNDEFYDLYAISNVKNTKYMATKSIVIYAYDNNSYVYLKVKDDINEVYLKKVLLNSCDKLLESTSVDEEHMSTHYTFVFVTSNKIEKSVKNIVKKFKKQKSFMFGLKGWSSIGLIVVSLDDNEVVFNRDAKKIYKSFRP